MDDSFQVNLLRNVQPADRKLSVSKEFVGPKRQDDKNRKHHHQGPEQGEKPPEKPMKLYGRDVPSGNTDSEEGTTIDITI